MLLNVFKKPAIFCAVAMNFPEHLTVENTIQNKLTSGLPWQLACYIYPRGIWHFPHHANTVEKAMQGNCNSSVCGQ